MHATKVAGYPSFEPNSYFRIWRVDVQVALILQLSRSTIEDWYGCPYFRVTVTWRGRIVTPNQDIVHIR